MASGFFLASSTNSYAKNLLPNEFVTEAVTTVDGKGWFDYKEGNDVYLDKLVTRAEVTQLFYEMSKDYDFTIKRTYNDNFVDINKDHPNYEEIVFSYEIGLFDGDSSKKFRPNAILTHAQLAKIIALWVEEYLEVGPLDKTTYQFNDLNSGHWAYEYVNSLTSISGDILMVNSEDKNFLPNKSVTLNDLAFAIGYSIFMKWQYEMYLHHSQ